MATQPINVHFDAEKFKSLYLNFNDTTVSNLPGIYSTTIEFKDPIHQLKGIAGLSTYFSGFCNTEIQCKFIFINQLINANQAFFQWEMHYQHPRLAGGKLLTLNGGTLIKFNTLIYYHEDFYDMGAMIYQHIPVLSWFIKKINTRVASSS